MNAMKTRVGKGQGVERRGIEIEIEIETGLDSIVGQEIIDHLILGITTKIDIEVIISIISVIIKEDGITIPIGIKVVDRIAIIIIIDIKVVDGIIIIIDIKVVDGIIPNNKVKITICSQVQDGMIIDSTTTTGGLILIDSRLAIDGTIIDHKLHHGIIIDHKLHHGIITGTKIHHRILIDNKM